MRRHGLGIKGVVYTPLGPAQRSLNAGLRRALGLYAHVVHVRGGPDGVDAVLVRENTEGEYAGLEHAPVPGVVESLKVVTAGECARVVRLALAYARAGGRSRVTCVHKANIMKLTDGAFLRVFRDLARQSGCALAGGGPAEGEPTLDMSLPPCIPGLDIGASAFASNKRDRADAKHSMPIQADDMIVDNAAMQMVARPAGFDVVVTSNLYGAVLANICAGLVGATGAVPGYNVGAAHVVYEPGARHVGRSLAGRDAASPASMLGCATLMLRHLGMAGHADAIDAAILAAQSRHESSAVPASVLLRAIEESLWAES